MKPTDLRLGNYIDKYGKPIKVDFGILQKIENGSVIYKPIPLTEEWLLKFGFKYREFLNDFFIKLDNHNILIAEKEVIGFAIYKCEENQRKYFLTKRYYVHQLQNLFYCLCGIDLELTLTE